MPDFQLWGNQWVREDCGKMTVRFRYIDCPFQAIARCRAASKVVTFVFGSPSPRALEVISCQVYSFESGGGAKIEQVAEGHGPGHEGGIEGKGVEAGFEAVGVGGVMRTGRRGGWLGGFSGETGGGSRGQEGRSDQGGQEFSAVKRSAHMEAILLP